MTVDSPKQADPGSMTRTAEIMTDSTAWHALDPARDAQELQVTPERALGRDEVATRLGRTVSPKSKRKRAGGPSSAGTGTLCRSSCSPLA